jgi:hypothetical protein
VGASRPPTHVFIKILPLPSLSGSVHYSNQGREGAINVCHPPCWSMEGIHPTIPSREGENLPRMFLKLTHPANNKMVIYKAIPLTVRIRAPPNVVFNIYIDIYNIFKT